MSAEAIVAISAAVTATVQLLKWAKLPDHWGPIVVILFSGVGVGIWLASQPDWPPSRTDTWEIFAGWISVALSAAGIFGFSRATAAAVTSISEPPKGGAGGPPTIKSGGQDTGPTIEEIADELERRMRATPAEPDPLISRQPAWLPGERERVVPHG